MTAHLDKQEYCGVWIVAEQADDKITSVSFELLAKAKELQKQAKTHESITAVLLGHELSGFPTELAEAGAENVVLVDHPSLRIFQNETYTNVLQALIQERKPAIVLMGATAAGSDLAPTLGAKLMTGVAAHCVDLRINESGLLVAVVPAFGGKVLGDILCPTHRPQMATVRTGLLNKPVLTKGVKCLVEKYVPSAALQMNSGRVVAISITREEVKGVPLEEAEVVIAGGYGVSSKEDWEQLYELAALLGGAIGCTRPPVDEGLISENQMIGTSGKSIRPKVYIGFGISGAAHHICGMKDSGLVISINKDENAPVFNYSDIGIVADAGQIVKFVVEKIKQI